MTSVSAELISKIHHVRGQAAAVRLAPGQRFALSSEISPGVRLVAFDLAGTPIVLSLWDHREDVVGLCGDERVPATTTLLAVDDVTLPSAGNAGLSIDIAALSPSKSVPGMYYALIHYASRREIRRAVQHLPRANGSSAIAA